ncbi:MAG TPA: hypothetical protein ENH82_08500 [bacterium]|nr:hypothetical protein [bacterium]
MLNITFERTQTERTDVHRQVQFSREPEHEARIVAHCKRVQREYFDSGLHYREMHQAHFGGIND